jgi:formate/nitrite transporter FocA (FNT family)
MTENSENVQVSGLDSKFMKVLLIIVAGLLIFVGPTYIPYLLSDILKVDYIASIIVGALLFILGLAMLIYLYRKKVIE